jgi:hypothetical protein
MASPKELIKLAAACRKAGIKSYKDADCEFTLTEDAPQRKSRAKSVAAPYAGPDKEFQTDSLTTDQLLMWSSAPGGAPFSGESEEAS